MVKRVIIATINPLSKHSKKMITLMMEKVLIVMRRSPNWREPE